MSTSVTLPEILPTLLACAVLAMAGAWQVERWLHARSWRHLWSSHDCRVPMNHEQRQWQLCSSSAHQVWQRGQQPALLQQLQNDTIPKAKACAWARFAAKC